MSHDNDNDNSNNNNDRRRKNYKRKTISPLKSPPNRNAFRRTQSEYSPNTPSSSGRKERKVRIVTRLGKKVTKIVRKKGDEMKDLVYGDYAYIKSKDSGIKGDEQGGIQSQVNKNGGARSMRLLREIQQDLNGDDTTDEDPDMEMASFGRGFGGIRGYFQRDAGLNIQSNKSNSNSNSNDNSNPFDFNLNFGAIGGVNDNISTGGSNERRGRGGRKSRASVGGDDSSQRTGRSRSKGRSKSKSKARSKSRRKSKSKSKIKKLSGQQADALVLDELNETQPPMDVRQVLPSNFDRQLGAVF